jgi:hypothetical protein|nr:MAG TPA: hypothetical protein [Caudoviricetes sp.]
MYTQEAINNNSINTRNKYYRAMVDYKYNKLINDYRNITCALTNPNLTKKDLYYLTSIIDGHKSNIMNEESASCIDSYMVTLDHKKLTLNIVNKDDTDIDDIIYTLKEDVVEIIQEAVVNINANIFATDHMLKENRPPIPYRKASNNELLANSIEVVNLMSKISVGLVIENKIKSGSYKLFCIKRILEERMTRHNALLLLESFDDNDSVKYYINKINKGLLISNIIDSVNIKVKSIKFKKGYSIKAVEDCAIRVMSRVFDIIKLDLEAVNYALTLFKEENKDTYGLPEDAVKFLDYFYRGIKAGYLPYKMIYLEGDIRDSYLSITNDMNIENPSVDDYKKQLDELSYATIVDGIIQYHQERIL